MKDYYKILGLSPDCSQEEIKKAYRKLARNSHPDSCGKEDSTQFRDVQEAYDAIGEKAKRNNYDKDRQTKQQQSQNIPIYSFNNRETGFSYPSLFDSYFDQILNQILSTDPFNTTFNNIKHQMELILTPEEARMGGIIPVEVPIYQSCPACRGMERNLFFFCDHCNGSGSIEKIIDIKIEIPPDIPDLSQFNFSIPGGGILNITVLIH